MNPQLKQRLIGAVVLISLAVIFIPILLDGNSSTRTRLAGKMPSPPDYKFETLEIPLQRPAKVDQPPVEPGSEKKPTSVEETAAPAAKPAPVEEKAGVTTEKRPVAPVTTTPEKKEQQESGNEVSLGWVVQLGSFSSADNAHALRSKLRKQGFEAYVETLKGSNGLIYRVRVGPEASREKAEATQERIGRKLKLQGIVMPRTP